MDKPIHFFPPDDASGGKGLCGAYLSRGWLDATDDPAKVTCTDCNDRLGNRVEPTGSAGCLTHASCTGTYADCKTR